MIIEKGALRYVGLREEDIELVRQWRNSPAINRYMEYRGYITVEAQKEWFESINNDKNLYCILEHEHKKIGLFNAKNINYDEMSCEGGVFFWDESYYNSPIPVITAMILGETFVRAFSIKVYAHILRSNRRAIRYNTYLGFELLPGQENVENQKYVLTLDSYLRKAAKFKKVFNLLVDPSPVIMILEPADYDRGLAQRIESIVDRTMIDEIRETSQGKRFVFG
jgi:RimJ/RimL family protein N-acetyltransferase